MTLLARATALVACSFLAACASSHYTTTEQWSSPDSAFVKFLHIGYVELSRWEGDEGDWSSSELFGEKALATSEGVVVQPEELGNWPLPAAAVSPLSNARSRLVSALQRGGATVMPGSMARAQVMFDCWVQEASENWQPGDISYCQSEFEKAMAEVEAALAQPAPPEPMAEPAPPPECQRSFLVFFDFDQSLVTPEAVGVVAEAAQAAEECSAVRITAIGHTDTSGSTQYNMSLSVRRGEAVRDELIRAGLFGSEIAILGLGEEDPLVPTGDSVREPQNRRVEIILEQ